MSLIIATKGGLNNDGLTTIYLHMFAKIRTASGFGFKYVGTTTGRSGLPGRQNFRTWAQQKPGVYEPCPEGAYKLGSHDAAGKWLPGVIDWKGAKGDYTSVHPVINSPVWIATSCTDLQGRYRAIGIHLDAGVPGTAGCIGLLMPQLKALVHIWNGYGPFTDLIVDWGKKTVKYPAGVTIPKHFDMIEV